MPESPRLGGFGHRIDGDLVNIATLKFYECLIALDRCQVLAELREVDRRVTVVEIGAGWPSSSRRVAQYDLRHRGSTADPVVLDRLSEGRVSR